MRREQFEYFKNICTKDTIHSILRESSEKMQTLEEAFGGTLHDIFKTKMTSELRSKAIERSASQQFTSIVGEEVVNPTTDNDPDLRFPNGYPLEVKVTANETFMGGDYSKRSSPTLLIAGSDSFFVALAYLEKEDWQPSSSPNFYAPSLKKPKIYELVQQGRAVVLCGELYEMMKKDGTPRKRKAFKMIKETVIK